MASHKLLLSMQQNRNFTLQNVKNPQRSTIIKEMQKTLLYSDIFDYPLTGEQLFQYLSIKVSGKKFLAALQHIDHTIVGKTIYYFLPKRQHLVEKRLLREKESRKKINRATHTVQLLGYIPTIRFIGISGSVALLNAEKRSDTDLFFITSAGSAWITRLVVYGLLYMFGLLRRKDKKVSHSLCVNMYVDERSLTFPSRKRNAYIAHEIIQLLPMVNKNNTFEKFLIANKWITNYFPNFQLPQQVGLHQKKSSHFFLAPLEHFVRSVQLWYMDQKKTRETTTDTLIAFHPIDYENLTLRAYEQRRKKYGI